MTSEFLGASPEKAEQLGATAEIGSMVLPIGFRRGRPAPGSDRAYFEVQDKKPTSEQIQQSKEARGTYGLGKMPLPPRLQTPP